MSRSLALLVLLCGPLSHLTSSEQSEIQQWSRATGGDTALDPATTSSTQFLASLSDTERQGAFLFQQRCNACHKSLDAFRAGPGSPLSIGPPLSSKNVENAVEAAAREQILNGSERMPAFRYGLEQSQVDKIIEYLKRVSP